MLIIYEHFKQLIFPASLCYQYNTNFFEGVHKWCILFYKNLKYKLAEEKKSALFLCTASYC